LLGMKQLGVIGEEDGHLHFDSFEILLGSASFIVMAFLEVGTAETPCLLLCLHSALVPCYSRREKASGHLLYQLLC
jgi:hypothetical protein